MKIFTLCALGSFGYVFGCMWLAHWLFDIPWSNDMGISFGGLSLMFVTLPGVLWFATRTATR